MCLSARRPLQRGRASPLVGPSASSSSPSTYRLSPCHPPTQIRGHYGGHRGNLPSERGISACATHPVARAHRTRHDVEIVSGSLLCSNLSEPDGPDDSKTS